MEFETVWGWGHAEWGLSGQKVFQAEAKNLWLSREPCIVCVFVRRISDDEIKTAVKSFISSAA